MSGLKVLSVASEIFPLVKTGGLADVTGALPGALKRARTSSCGRSCRPIPPSRPSSMRSRSRGNTAICSADRRECSRASPRASISSPSTRRISTTGPATPISARTGCDWPDNAHRFAALARVGADIGLGAIGGFAARGRSRPRLAGRAGRRLSPFRRRASGPRQWSPSTISPFRATFRFRHSRSSACPERALTIDGVEYFGGVGYLKAGLRLADSITTVSPTYAREIMTPEFGMALDGLLALARLCRARHPQRHRRRRLESRRRCRVAAELQRPQDRHAARATRRRCKASSD